MRSAVALLCRRVHQSRSLLEQLERSQRSRDRRGRQGGGEDEGTGSVDEVRGHRLVAGHERAVGSERLSQRAHDHVDLVLESRLGDRAAPARPERAGAVGLVDEDAQTPWR